MDLATESQELTLLTAHAGHRGSAPGRLCRVWVHVGLHMRTEFLH